MRQAALFLCLSLSFALSGAARGGAIWIDTDPSLGAPWREVDDAFALALAFHSPEARIAGISTTYGNAGLPRTTAVARDLVRRFGSAAQIFAGAASARDGSKPTAATDALSRALRKERLTYVALGPLTNLAAFCRLHPSLTSRIERVIFVGGISPGKILAFGPKGSWRIHDANVFKDPAAVAAVVATSIPLSLAPVETSSRLTLSKADWRGLRGSEADFLYRKSAAWMWFWTSFVHERGAPLFDALAALGAFRPALIRAETRHARVNEKGELIAAKRPAPGSRRIQFVTGFNSGAADFVRQRLARRPLR